MMMHEVMDPYRIGENLSGASSCSPPVKNEAIIQLDDDASENAVINASIGYVLLLINNSQHYLNRSLHPSYVEWKSTTWKHGPSINPVVVGRYWPAENIVGYILAHWLHVNVERPTTSPLLLDSSVILILSTIRAI